MRILLMRSNRLEGAIDLTHLPEDMRVLNLGINLFSGSVDLTQLPESMVTLHLQDNQFTGSLDFAHLPHNMKLLDIQGSCLSGNCNATNLPPGLDKIEAQDNQFNAFAVVDPKTKAQVCFIGSGVSSVADENGNEKEGVWRWMAVNTDGICQKAECQNIFERFVRQKAT